MHAAYQGLLLVHVVFALLGLVAFWVPIFARKGGTAHIRAGRVFLYAAYVVAATAVGIVVLTTVSPFGTHPEARPSDPAQISAAVAELRIIELFLGYLAIVTFTSVYHGVRTIQAKRETESLRSPLHTGAAWASILAALGILFFAITSDHPARWIFFALSPLGLLVGGGALRYARRPAASPMAHWYEHLGAMIGGGIAFHTAFAVFGIQRFVDYSLEGVLGLIPWVLPTLIGVPAIQIWGRHYRKRFGELGEGRTRRSAKPARNAP